MSPKMKRMQLYIEPELDQELQRLARSLHVSKAHLVREGARRVVQEGQPEEPDSLLSIVDLVKSKGGRPSRISEDHDKYLAEWELDRGKKKKDGASTIR